MAQYPSTIQKYKAADKKRKSKDFKMRVLEKIARQETVKTIANRRRALALLVFFPKNIPITQTKNDKAKDAPIKNKSLKLVINQQGQNLEKNCNLETNISAESW